MKPTMCVLWRPPYLSILNSVSSVFQFGLKNICSEIVDLSWSPKPTSEIAEKLRKSENE